MRPAEPRPRTVIAFGDLRFYGRENAEERGITQFYSRANGRRRPRMTRSPSTSPPTTRCAPCTWIAEAEDGYYRDQSVFGDGISVEDTMALLVRYDSGAVMTHSLNAYQPWEGFRIAFNGSKGRIELLVVESSYVSASGAKADEGAALERSLKVSPHFGKPYQVDIASAAGGHGGGDPVLLEDVFGDPPPDPYRRRASHVDGA